MITRGPGSNEARDLLERQRIVLTSVIEAIETGSDDEAARNAAIKLLDDLSDFIRRNALGGPVRGIAAAATITLANVLGAELHWASQLLITGSIVGEKLIEALKGWGKSDGEANDD